MKITFLGTGTSTGTPLIGCACAVCRSNDPYDQRLRSSLFVEVEEMNILIDIGPDFRQQMLRTQIERIDTLLLTHEHNDHIIGLDEIRAFNFLQGEQIPVYATERVRAVLKRRFAYLFEEQLYPGVPRVELHDIPLEQAIQLPSIEVIPIQYWHGRLPVVGFRIRDMAYLTDFKSINEAELSKLVGLDTLIISALRFSGYHHSHLNLSEALDWAKRIGAQRTYLMHIGHRMGRHIDVQPTLPEHIFLAYDGLQIEW